jgi:hypothetical protein
MAYQRKHKRYRIIFEDGDYAGLEVAMRGLTVDEMLDMSGAADAVKAQANPDTLNVFVDRFAAALISWNMVDEDDNPIPATREAVGEGDLDELMAITEAWMDRMTAVSPALKAGSTDGMPSEVASIPMEPFSPNPQS